MFFLDTGTTHPLMTSKSIVGRVAALQTLFVQRNNTTRNERGNTMSGMTSTKWYAMGVKHRPSANREVFSPERLLPSSISEIHPSQEGTEKTMLLDKVIEINI